jgi:1-acyl-sn-glycerol-3-phosphate acyltransferase
MIAPEHTRSRTEDWKTGFYYIAKAAKVPIVFGYYDYPSKKIGLGEVVQPGLRLEATLRRIRNFYADKRGRHPEQFALPRLE